ncbi:hypothetical protein [Sphingobium cloacae]|uniref:Uncharacterized protein n=1 Tax=Sphingobium cloacae TaxID=120107 RepID=A0A1E1F2H3_9SPHN|nr:hypothetical protein [Sphingobium cloacae]BAV64723.1 hypothetical protein SCLO_1016830 [Sphingobium cloacae]
MTLLWKGVAALGLAIAGLSATAMPAQARDHGYRDGWRGDRDHRWNDRRHWREDRRHWRGDRRDWRRHDGRHYRSHWRGHRQRCWNEWRYDYYRDRRVRVRICR